MIKARKINADTNLKTLLVTISLSLSIENNSTKNDVQDAITVKNKNQNIASEKGPVLKYSVRFTDKENVDVIININEKIDEIRRNDFKVFILLSFNELSFCLFFSEFTTYL